MEIDMDILQLNGNKMYGVVLNEASVDQIAGVIPSGRSEFASRVPGAVPEKGVGIR